MTALNHHVLCNGIRIRSGIRTHALISGSHGIHADEIAKCELAGAKSGGAR